MKVPLHFIYLKRVNEMKNFNLTENELEELKKAKTDDEAWKNLCNEIKRKRGGQFPPDWHKKVIANPEIDTSFTIKTFKTLEELLNHLNLD